jgi:hypothetical protein
MSPRVQRQKYVPRACCQQPWGQTQAGPTKTEATAQPSTKPAKHHQHKHTKPVRSHWKPMVDSIAPPGVIRSYRWLIDHRFTPNNGISACEFTGLPRHGAQVVTSSRQPCRMLFSILVSRAAIFCRGVAVGSLSISRSLHSGCLQHTT